MALYNVRYRTKREGSIETIVVKSKNKAIKVFFKLCIECQYVEILDSKMTSIKSQWRV